MPDIKKLLKHRIGMKKKKPVFKRQDHYRRRRLDTGSWRKPKGIHSKMRMRRAGHRKIVSAGYKSPLAVRRMNSSGLMPVVVHTAGQLLVLDTKTQGAIIASSVGDRKRLELIATSQEKGITILNIKDPAAYAAEAQKLMQERKKAPAAKEAKAAPAKKKKLEEALTDEEKKKAEKEEKDKVLTKAGGLK